LPFDDAMLKSSWLCFFLCTHCINFVVTFFTLPVSELSLVRLALDLVD